MQKHIRAYRSINEALGKIHDDKTYVRVLPIGSSHPEDYKSDGEFIYFTDGLDIIKQFTNITLVGLDLDQNNHYTATAYVQGNPKDLEKLIAKMMGEDGWSWDAEEFGDELDMPVPQEYKNQLANYVNQS